MSRRSLEPGLVAPLALALSLATVPTGAQEDPKPGFNLFTVQQDVEIGRQSAAEAERQLPVLRNASLESYLNAVAGQLAEAAPGARYPYRVRAVDASEINAFTFPGGFIYVNRGLIDAARSEGELAGVLAHEMAHVALRHGTHQASKAYAAQAGLGILGGLLGGDGGSGSTSGKILQTVGGIGLNAVFLKFSRNAEHEADLVGIRMMKRTGYDPRAMVSFFELLDQQRARDPGKLERFFSSHPAPSDRVARLEAEARRLGPVERPREVGDFARIQDEIGGRPSSRSTAALVPGRAEPERPPERRVPRPAIDDPSSQLRRFQQRNGLFAIDYPRNWRAYAADRGYGVVIAPERCIIQTQTGRQDVVCGVVINHYDPFDGRDEAGLREATDDLVGQIRRASPHLRIRSGPERRQTLDGARSLSLVLSGPSPVTGSEERVEVVTRELADGHVLYALLVAPRADSARLDSTFERMVDSLRVDDRMAHR